MRRILFLAELNYLKSVAKICELLGQLSKWSGVLSISLSPSQASPIPFPI